MVVHVGQDEAEQCKPVLEDGGGHWFADRRVAMEIQML